MWSRMYIYAGMKVCVAIGWASLAGVVEIPRTSPAGGVVWTCSLHRKRLTGVFLTWTVGQREEGRRDVKRKRSMEEAEAWKTREHEDR